MDRERDEIFKETSVSIEELKRRAKEPFIDKTTLVKSSERIKFKAEPFAKGYKVHVEWAFNPDNTYHLDQVLKWESSEVQRALQSFIKNVIEGELGGRLIRDDIH